MNICIIGNDSFDNIRVGTNHIAESLSKQGHKVDYITVPACLMTIFSKKHRKRYLNSFKNRAVNKNLNEIVPVCIFPKALIKFLEGTRLEKVAFDINKKFIKTRKGYIENKKYDICIFSVSDSFYFINKIKANNYIYRHNDILEGFQSTPNIYTSYENYLLRNFPITFIATVNNNTAQYIRNKNDKLKIKVVPNGINMDLFNKAKPDKNLIKTKNKNIIYMGVIEFWVDINLIVNTAIILKDYKFHIYGKWPKEQSYSIPNNIFLHQAIKYNKVPEKLKACSVGIIPFNKYNTKMFVEKPLKYYEYLASGLGIASTSYGVDINNKFVFFGDTPEEFAQAILNSFNNKHIYEREKQYELNKMQWKNISKDIIRY